MRSSSSRLFQIQHVTEYKYELPLQRAVMLLRLQPLDSECQTVLSFNCEIAPDAQIVALPDSFGNNCHLVNFHAAEQSVVTIKSSSAVRTTQAPPERFDNLEVTWDKFDASSITVDFWDFLAPSARVYDCDDLQGFLAENSLTRGNDALRALRRAAECMHQKIRYKPGATTVDSSIQECLRIGSGVCQDFTHIMAAIGRSWKVPSRYVSGYLHLLAESKEMITEDASHAWVEFFVPDIGWVGLDATNNTIVDDRYVRLAVGRDYEDIAPTKGVVYGGGKSTLSVRVKLTNGNPEQALQSDAEQ